MPRPRWLTSPSPPSPSAMSTRWVPSTPVSPVPQYPSVSSTVPQCVQVKRSELARANTSGLLSGYTNTYLVNHFLIGQKLEQQPDNWTR